jgi:hypothetical protein
MYAWVKYGPATIFALAFLVGPAALGAPLEGCLLMAPVGVAAGLACYLYGRQFRRVTLVDSCFAVADGEGELHFPLSAIESVRQDFWSNPIVVSVFLRDPSPFGRRIMFIANDPGFIPFWRDCETVLRLRRLLENSQAATCAHAPARPLV